MAKAKLKKLLDRHQGKDPKLEKDKRLRKNAAKRKSVKMRQLENKIVNDEEAGREEEDVERNGKPTLTLQEQMEAIMYGNGNSEEGQELDGEDVDAEEDGWVSDEESEGIDEFDEDGRIVDTSRLADSDSESSAQEDEDDEEQSGRIQDRDGSYKNGIHSQSGNATTADEEEDEAEVALSDIGSSADEVTEDLVPYQRLTINNTTALTRALHRIKIPVTELQFSTHQSITSEEPTHIEDVEDDVDRELAFEQQSLDAIIDARGRLFKEDPKYPFSRPRDYFAEMVKNDEHMGKVKSKLMQDAASKKAAQDAKKQRELKKMGKQVQMEKLKERAKEKKEMLEKVNSLKRKRQGAGLNTAGEEDMFDVAIDEAADDERKQTNRNAANSKNKGDSNHKRRKKDEKFGFGGKKRFAKSGDALSSADMRGYPSKRAKASKKTGAAKRPGKSRRAKTR